MSKIIRVWEDSYSALLYRGYIYPIDDKDRIENRSEFVLVDEISEWCKTNDIKYRTIMSWDYDNPDLRHPMITFNTIEDAMAFKLQWS